MDIFLLSSMNYNLFNIELGYNFFQKSQLTNGHEHGSDSMIIGQPKLIHIAIAPLFTYFNCQNHMQFENRHHFFLNVTR